MNNNSLHGWNFLIITILQALFMTDIHLWLQVYFYEDLNEQQFVGSSQAPVLSTFPLFISQHMPPRDVVEKLAGVLDYGASSFITFPKPIFEKNLKITLGDLVIELRTNTGDLVVFSGDDQTTEALLFRSEPQLHRNFTFSYLTLSQFFGIDTMLNF